MFFLLLLHVVSNVDAEPEGRCYTPYCLEDGYQKAALPSKAPVRVEVSPFLSEVFRVNDNDFSITCEIAVKFSWIESRLNFTKEKNYSGHLDEELLDHIWLPKVEIRHLEKDVINTKSLLPQTVLGITVKKGVVWL